MADRGQVESVLAEASHARRRLSLEEVVDAGLPAVYQGFGERLLYVDGTIFDARDPSAPAEIPLGVGGESDQAVGLEFGWQHVGDCSCLFCSTRPANEAA
jgi:hypothetical protein